MLRPDSKGMTLTEVMVYCLLMAIFATMLFINLPQRGNQTSEDLRQASHAAAKALTAANLELSNASASSIASLLSPPGLIFLSAQSSRTSNISYTSSGEVAWRGWVGYFLRGSELVRVWSPLSSPSPRSSVGLAPSAASMLAAGKPEVVCRGVKSFKVINLEANLWQTEIVVSVSGSQVSVSSAAGARN